MKESTTTWSAHCDRCNIYSIGEINDYNPDIIYTEEELKQEMIRQKMIEIEGKTYCSSCYLVNKDGSFSVKPENKPEKSKYTGPKECKEINGVFEACKPA